MDEGGVMASPYPTDDELRTIETFDFTRDPRGFMNLVCDSWDEDYGILEHGDVHYIFITGGWSGNESVIGAMQTNTVFWDRCWYSTVRGGRYEFHLDGAISANTGRR